MRAKKTMRRMLTITAVCAVTLLVGFVYAALNGTLAFNGEITLSGDCELKITDVTITSNGGSYTDADADFNDEELLVFGSILKPGESITADFEVENTGTLDVVFNGFTYEDDNAVQLTIGGDYLTDMDDGEVIAAGESISSTLTITWDGTQTFVDGDEYYFRFALDYEADME